jgi:NAD(P)-dependent dehydrogenase (short-subunit alcohol dehydrogenase family)
MSDDNLQPPQSQEYPGSTAEMTPPPQDEMAGYQGRGLLEGKRALVTGGDSGIGRAVSVAFAKEGADVAVAYLCEHDDARHTADLVEAAGRRCFLIPGDILVNNIGYHEPVESLRELSTEQWDRTFRTNVYSYFWCTRAALGHLGKGSSIINTSSVNGLRGNATLLDYSASKGAVIALTYALAQNLTGDGIRVNCVAPGPVWTPLIPATLDEEKVATFGDHVPMGRPAQPDEIAPSYVFFAADSLSSYYTGEVLAPVGGQTMPG